MKKFLAAWPFGFCLLACTFGWVAVTNSAAGTTDTTFVVSAPEPLPVYQLPPVSVTADAVEKVVHENPGYADEITGFDLRHRLQPRTVPEALIGLPGVSVQKTAHGQGSPYIRGFTGFRTLFLIDGIRLNNSVFRDGPNQYGATVDPHSLSQLTVVRGPNAVLQGSEAVGGLVQAATRSWRTESADEPFAPVLRTRYASAEGGRMARAEAAGRLGARSGYFLGMSAKRHGDLKAGPAVGNQPHTGYDDLSLDARVDSELTDRWGLSAVYQQSRLDDAWRTHQTVYGVSWRGTSVGTEKRRSLDNRRRLLYAQLRGTELSPQVDRVLLSVSHHRQREERHRVRADDRSDRQGFDVGTLGLRGEVEARLLGVAWIAGADAYLDRVDSFARRYAADGTPLEAGIQGPVADDARYDLAGAFWRGRFTIGPRAELHAGGRFTHARADARRVQDPRTGAPTWLAASWHRLTGSTRLTVHLDDEKRRTLFAGIAQAFRAPNLSDLTRFDSARTNEFEVAAPDLQPEEFQTYDVGIKTLSPGWSMQAAVFLTDIRGMIVRAPTGHLVDGLTEVTKKNSGHGYLVGAELGWRTRIHPEWFLSGAAAATYGETDVFPTSEAVARREVLDRLPPWGGQLGLLWRHPTGRRWAEGAVLVAGAQHRLSSRDLADTQRIPPGGTPGYAVVSLRSGWELGRRLTLDLAVENLFDRDYRIHGSGLNEPGRNIVVGLAASI